MTKISMKVNEYNGDNIIELTFPTYWNVKEVKMVGHNKSSLTNQLIKNALQNPVNSSTLKSIVKGKKGRIAITCDDLMRPTPTNAVLPRLVEELNMAGISDDQIFILGATGAHMQMNVDSFRRKIGWDMVARFDCVSHNCWQNFIDLGLTKRRTPLLINKEFVKADVRIGISGIKKHGNAGAGGGGKIVLPGVSSLQTILWNHTYVRYKYGAGEDANSNVGDWNIKYNEARADMQEAAKRAQLDFSINCSYNNNRELIGLHAGDLDNSWIEAVKYTYNMHSTPLPKEKADIVVINSYMRGDASIDWSLARETVKEGGSVVAINETPGVGNASLGHYFKTLDESWSRLNNYKIKTWPVKNAKNIIIYTTKPVKRNILIYNNEVQWISNWEEVINKLVNIHGKEASVYVFPAASIQFDPKKSPLVIE